jgi:hypothetical protein
MFMKSCPSPWFSQAIKLFVFLPRFPAGDVSAATDTSSLGPDASEKDTIAELREVMTFFCFRIRSNSPTIYDWA